MERALGTFAITAAMVALIIVGLVYPWIGGAIVAIMVFAGLWAMTDATFGHHFDNRT